MSESISLLHFSAQLLSSIDDVEACSTCLKKGSVRYSLSISLHRLGSGKKRGSVQYILSICLIRFRSEN